MLIRVSGIQLTRKIDPKEMFDNPNVRRKMIGEAAKESLVKRILKKLCERRKKCI